MLGNNKQLGSLDRCYERGVIFGYKSALFVFQATKTLLRHRPIDRADDARFSQESLVTITILLGNEKTSTYL